MFQQTHTHPSYSLKRFLALVLPSGPFSFIFPSLPLLASALSWRLWFPFSPEDSFLNGFMSYLWAISTLTAFIASHLKELAILPVVKHYTKVF